jgi:hypothetical protein
MAKFRPYVEAVQWIGTNVTEIRQFVRSNAGLVTEAVIRDGVLYLEANPVKGVGLTTVPIMVPLNSWAVRVGGTMTAMTPEEFVALYEPDP